MSLRPLIDDLVRGFNDAGSVSVAAEYESQAAWCEQMAKHYATSEAMGKRYRLIAALLLAKINTTEG